MCEWFVGDNTKVGSDRVGFYWHVPKDFADDNNMCSVYYFKEDAYFFSNYYYLESNGPSKMYIPVKPDPCRFCDEPYVTNQRDQSGHFVKCMNALCGARGPIARSLNGAISKWNIENSKK